MTDIAKMRLVYVNANINGEMDFQKVKKLFPPHTLSADGYPFENHVTPEQLAQPMDLPLNAVCALFNTDTLISQMGELNSMQPSEENKLALRQKREILRCYIDTLADHAGEIPMNENVAWNLLQP